MHNDGVGGFWENTQKYLEVKAHKTWKFIRNCVNYTKYLCYFKRLGSGSFYR
jgi:hypothetical protein